MLQCLFCAGDNSLKDVTGRRPRPLGWRKRELLLSDSLAVDEWKKAVALMMDKCKAKYKPWIIDKEGKAGGQKGQNGQFRRFVSMGDGDDEYARIRVVLYIQKNGEKECFAFLFCLDFRFFWLPAHAAVPKALLLGSWKRWKRAQLSAINSAHCVWPHGPCY